MNRLKFLSLGQGQEKLAMQLLDTCLGGIEQLLDVALLGVMGVDFEDVLVGRSLESLAPGATVATGSVRRRAQLAVAASLGR